MVFIFYVRDSWYKKQLGACTLTWWEALVVIQLTVVESEE